MKEKGNMKFYPLPSWDILFPLPNKVLDFLGIILLNFQNAVRVTDMPKICQNSNILFYEIN